MTAVDHEIELVEIVRRPARGLFAGRVETLMLERCGLGEHRLCAAVRRLDSPEAPK